MPKKYIIAGGRDFRNWDFFIKCTHYIFNADDFEVVSGGAPGADFLGEYFARKYNQPIVHFLADWDTYGKAAGPIRNEQMAKYADACIVFWDGKSKGTKNMIDNAIKYKLELHIFFY